MKWGARRLQLGIESDSVYLPGELWDSKSNLLLFFSNKYVLGAKVRFFLHIPTHFWKISYGLIENCMFEGSTLLIQFTGFCVLRMRKSVCERLLSAMTRRRVSTLVKASVLSVGCSASATVCCAVGRQESNARAAIRRKRYFALFIQWLTVFRNLLLHRLAGNSPNRLRPWHNSLGNGA